MPRRSPYTRVEKEGQTRPAHVEGMGDVVFKGFQCLNHDCQHFIMVREDEIGPDFEITCPTCDFVHQAGGETEFFNYRLVHLKENEVIEDGSFVCLHGDYIREAKRFKYCLLCYALKPLALFSIHSVRQSRRQGECRLCKTIYNGIKNQSRITDQHREASQRRRLYKRLAGEAVKIDSKAIFEKFGGKCFNCGRDLHFTLTGQQDFNLDHTLPAKLLWPLDTDNATLLCLDCNNEKHDQWPFAYYSDKKLRKLARLTGFTYDVLSGSPVVNAAALDEILTDPDAFIEEWIHYPENLRKVRRMIQDHADIDIFENAKHVPSHLLVPAQTDD